MFTFFCDLSFSRAVELCAGISEAAAKGKPVEEDDVEEDVFQLVKLCMNAREYRRAAFLAANCHSPRVVFMRRYSTYLVRAMLLYILLSMFIAKAICHL